MWSLVVQLTPPGAHPEHQHETVFFFVSKPRLIWYASIAAEKSCGSPLYLHSRHRNHSVPGRCSNSSKSPCSGSGTFQRSREFLGFGFDRSTDDTDWSSNLSFSAALYHHNYILRLQTHFRLVAHCTVTHNNQNGAAGEISTNADGVQALLLWERQFDMGTHSEAI